MSRLPTALIAAGTLLLGFALAQLTDVRALGGLVLLAGVVWAVAREARRTPWWRIGAVVVVGALCFAASHVLAGTLGAWPSVALAAAVLGAVTFALVDRSSTGTTGLRVRATPAGQPSSRR